jgi:hypothetical protein
MGEIFHGNMGGRRIWRRPPLRKRGAPKALPACEFSGTTRGLIANNGHGKPGKI